MDRHSGVPAGWRRTEAGAPRPAFRDAPSFPPTPGPALRWAAGRAPVRCPFRSIRAGAPWPLLLAATAAETTRVHSEPHPFPRPRTSTEMQSAAAFSDLPPRSRGVTAGRLHLQTLQRKLETSGWPFASHLNIVLGSRRLPRPAPAVSHLGVLSTARTLTGWGSPSLSSRSASAVAR